MKQLYIGILILKMEYRVGREFIFLIESLETCVDKLLLYCADLSEINFIDDGVKELLSGMEIIDNFSVLMQEVENISCEKIVICDNSFFGPFYPWEYFFETMKQYDFWGLEEYGKHIDSMGNIIEASLQPYFVVLDKSMLVDAYKTEKCDIGRFAYEYEALINKAGYKYRVCLATTETDNVHSEDKGKVCPYELVVDKKFPVLRKDALISNRIENLRFNYANQVAELLGYIKEKLNYDADIIYDYIIKSFKPAEVKDIVGAYYIMDSADFGSISNEIYNVTAVAAHMYYEDKFEECLGYLASIPKAISVYITVKSEEAKAHLISLLGEAKERYTVIISSGIGRDWGALILDLWPYLDGYEYICFVHDKKTTGGNWYPSVGNAFMDMTWDSLLCSESHINQILQMFIDNGRLGVLVPPMPYSSDCMKLWGNTWTVCYEETVKLTQKLGLKKIPTQKSVPYAFSSMFWFRKEALLPIFITGYKAEDFPVEPMPTDGTLNHALERIIVYVAAEQGYYSGIVQNKEIARNNLLNYECMLRVIMTDLRNASGIISVENLLSGELYRKADEMRCFVLQNEQIGIYGTGNIAKEALEYVEDKGRSIECFIVSDGYKKEEQIHGYRVCELGEIKKNIGIVVAVGERYKYDVINNLKAYGFDKYVMFA